MCGKFFRADFITKKKPSLFAFFLLNDYLFFPGHLSQLFWDFSNHWFLLFLLFSGEGCVEKPMSTLWRNYVQHYKPEVVMRIKVSSSGLKATTKQHGLTEYWSHRITHCAAPENFPRVFCWIYRHEGRKLKHELRCHAVLCSKESIARDISVTLQVRPQYHLIGQQSILLS